MENLFSLFEVAIGAYLIYGAITGAGQMFRNENIKKGMEQKYRKTMRICSAILGPLMVALGILDYLSMKSPSPLLTTAVYVLWGVTFVGIVLLFVITLRMTDRTKAKQQQHGGATKGAPRSAFEFDEEETKPQANNKTDKGNKK